MNIQIPDNQKRHIERVSNLQQSTQARFRAEIALLLPIGYAIESNKSNDISVYRSKNPNDEIDFAERYWTLGCERVLCSYSSSSISICDGCNSNDIYKLSGVMQLMVEAKIGEMIGSDQIVKGQAK